MELGWFWHVTGLPPDCHRTTTGLLPDYHRTAPGPDPSAPWPGGHMIHPMTGPDHHLALAMERAWPMLAALVARLCALAGLDGERPPERISRAVHTHILRLLRPAEAVARRLIVLMARAIPAPAEMAAKAALSPIHREAKRSGDQTGNAHFQLFETLPTLAAWTRERREKPAGPGPRILFLDQPLPVIAAPDPGLPAAPLIARIRGLQKVLKDPKRRAKRHARFLLRKARANTPPGRVNPVRPGHAPGARSRYTPPELKDLLAHLTAATRRGPPGISAGQALRPIPSLTASRECRQ